MSGCCATPAAKTTRQTCPSCGQACLPVSYQTLIHQVQFPENQALEDVGYAYCADPQCGTVYFSSSHSITKSQLRVYHKNQPTMLCYCFDISTAAYQSALQANTAPAIKAFVVAQTKAATCSCEIRNPSGRCCLANFKRMEQDNER